MRVGLQIPFFNWDGTLSTQLAQVAQTAEDAGFYSLWVMDHFFQMEVAGDARDPMLEAYTTLGYLAALTQHMKFGVLVTGVIYRYPAILAKIVSTLDVLSDGRAYLGIGAAWYEREALGLGLPFPTLKVRFEQLEETLQIVRQMWSPHEGAYNGQHFQLQETINQPQPISQPYPPIMVGGAGEKKTLRMVAQYADASNFDTRMGIDGIKHKLSVLRGHCENLGRDYDTIEKTLIHHVHDDDGLKAVPDLCRQWAELGVQHVIFGMRDVEKLDRLHIFKERIIPVVNSL